MNKYVVALVLLSGKILLEVVSGRLITGIRVPGEVTFSGEPTRFVLVLSLEVLLVAGLAIWIMRQRSHGDREHKR